MMNQRSAPLFEALKKHVDQGVVPFHVPGHKYGRGLPELREYLGDRVFQIDVNGMSDLDYLNHPTGVIKQAQQLFADACGAASAYFLVNGTSSGVQAMIISTCEPGSEIIMPRNAHKSAIGGLILSGARPVYVQPEINRELGISMGVTAASIKQAIRQHPHARAVFIINPTYYGMTSELQAIVELAHLYNMAVLVDEAHGAHLYFHPEFPLNAMAAGADMSAVSIHKTGGSFTQSSVLLENSRFITPERIKQALELTMTSSSSYLLMCSLDLARKQLATWGQELLKNTLQISRQARQEINQIEGLRAFGPELIGSPGCFSFDETKLGINICRLGYTGYQMETILREGYNIQIELADIYNILAIVSLGDRKEDLAALIQALKKIASSSACRNLFSATITPECPEMVVSPREAFYSPAEPVLLAHSAGEIAGEMIMAYPPGIPVICPGERITSELIDYISLLKEERCELQGPSDPHLEYITVLKRYPSTNSRTGTRDLSRLSR